MGTNDENDFKAREHQLREQIRRMHDEQLARELQADGGPLPPWRKHPELERYSMGWRMGYGVAYALTLDVDVDAPRAAVEQVAAAGLVEMGAWLKYWEEENAE